MLVKAGIECIIMTSIHIQGLFQGGAFAPPMKVFAPPQELVELTY